MENKEKTKKEEKKISPLKKVKDKLIKINRSHKKLKSILQRSDVFPKNANEFKHIMDDITCGVPDIEYMLMLRRPKKYRKIEKTVSSNSPSFYDEDFKKFKKKMAKDPVDKALLQTNMGNFRQIFSDRAKYAINDTQFKFEVQLRNNTRYISRNGNQQGNNLSNIKFHWAPTVLPRSRSLFDTMLPPLLNRSREIFQKLDDKIGRPLMAVKKEGMVNGIKVKSRVFEYNKNLALRYPSEHFPSSRYTNNYGIQNFGSFSHLVSVDSKPMQLSWSTFLRGDKSTRLPPAEIKKREKKLKEKNNDKIIFPKS